MTSRMKKHVLLTMVLPMGFVAVAAGAYAAPLSLGVRNEIRSWDPAMANVTDTQQIYQAAYDTIIRRLPDGTLEPMLGLEWSYDESQTALTVRLREGVTFSDGVAFDANAVKANLENLQVANGPQSATVANVDSVEVVDDFTVVYHLKSPDPAFLIYLSGTAGFQGSPDKVGTPEIVNAPVGTGPYVFDPAQSAIGSSYVFTAREGYWAPELQQFDTISFKLLPDETARVNALLSGQIDGGLMTANTIPQIENAGKNVIAYEIDWVGLFLMDRAGEIEPALGDVRVRRAINLALDRKAFLQIVLNGRGTATSQPFGPATPAFSDALEDFYPYDPGQAKALMVEAGYADGFVVKAPITANFGADVVRVLTQQLADIGITVQWETQPNWGSFVGAVSSGDYPMPIMAQVQGDAWVETQKLIAPTGLYNPLAYTDPTVDGLIETMRSDPAAYAEAAGQLGEYIVDQAWFAPIYRLQLIYAADPKLEVVPQVQVSAPAIYNYRLVK